MNKEQNQEYSKAYREINREHILEKKRIYRENHREELREKARIYKQQNREEINRIRRKEYKHQLEMKKKNYHIWSAYFLRRKKRKRRKIG